jgi:hypothetical protein
MGKAIFFVFACDLRQKMLLKILARAEKNVHG